MAPPLIFPVFPVDKVQNRFTLPNNPCTKKKSNPESPDPRGNRAHLAMQNMMTSCLNSGQACRVGEENGNKHDGPVLEYGGILG